MASKRSTARKQDEEAFESLTTGLKQIQGVQSIHMTAGPGDVSVMDVLVDSEEDEIAAIELELSIFSVTPELPVDMRVHPMKKEDRTALLEAFSNSPGLLWSRN